MPPRVSVNMPVYNGELYVAQTIQSVLSQTYADFEFVIIDDGSTDESLAILERYAKQDKRIRIISRENRGLVATRNELLAESRGEFVALIDADDIAVSSRFERQVAYLERHTDCVLLGSRVLLVDPEGEPLREMIDFYDHDAIDGMNLRGGSSHICQPSVMMRLESVRSLGGYRDGFAPAEDVDLFLRLAERGRIANLPETLLKYRQHLHSQGYAAASMQQTNADRAANEARLRRGLPLLESKVGKPISRGRADAYRKWGWWALGYHRSGVALRYAIRSLILAPWSLKTWRLLVCSIRGH